MEIDSNYTNGNFIFQILTIDTISHPAGQKYVSLTHRPLGDFNDILDE